MNGLKTGLGITPGEHIISADSALSRNIRHCFCLSCRAGVALCDVRAAFSREKVL